MLLLETVRNTYFWTYDFYVPQRSFMYVTVLAYHVFVQDVVVLAITFFIF
jgi:hypothetical protein